MLSQWKPGIVLGFGELDEVFMHAMRRPHYFWIADSTAHLRLAVDRIPFNADRCVRSAQADKALDDVVVDSEATAVELPGGQLLTFGTLIGATLDSSAAPPANSVEGSLIRMLRMARGHGTRGAPRVRPAIRQPWWAEPHFSGLWPPRRTHVSMPSPWTPIMDHESGDEYYWNQETGETTWEVPAGGRHSYERALRLVRSSVLPLGTAFTRKHTSRSVQSHQQFSSLARHRSNRHSGMVERGRQSAGLTKNICQPRRWHDKLILFSPSSSSSQR